MKVSVAIILFVLASNNGATLVKVTRVIDGDTIEIETGEKIRMIGINAPELNEQFGTESKKHLALIILGKHVYLEADKISKSVDVYGRQLRYIVIEGQDINERMISDGYAFAYLKYKFERHDEYVEAQGQARNKNLGVWGDDDATVDEVGSEDERHGEMKPSPKFYFVGGLVILLVLVGLITLMRK